MKEPKNLNYKPLIIFILMLDNTNTINMESIYVVNSYNNIAQHFNQTRINHWESVKNFVNSLPTSSKLLDAGCGNGKNMEIRSDLDITGCDSCENLVKICHEKNLNVILADIRKIPFNDNTFDNIICIAVLHHLATFEDRLNSLNEMIRLLKPNGQLLFQVWAIEQKLNKNKFIKINEDDPDNTDYFVTWKNNNEITKRYYHLFSEKELDHLVSKIDNIKIINKLFEKNNWCFIIQKTN